MRLVLGDAGAARQRLGGRGVDGRDAGLVGDAFADALHELVQDRDPLRRLGGPFGQALDHRVEARIVARQARCCAARTAPASVGVSA